MIESACTVTKDVLIFNYLKDAFFDYRRSLSTRIRISIEIFGWSWNRICTKRMRIHNTDAQLFTNTKILKMGKPYLLLRLNQESANKYQAHNFVQIVPYCTAVMSKQRAISATVRYRY
jgi:hypothetical protein